MDHLKLFSNFFLILLEQYSISRVQDMKYFLFDERHYWKWNAMFDRCFVKECPMSWWVKPILNQDSKTRKALLLRYVFSVDFIYKRSNWAHLTIALYIDISINKKYKGPSLQYKMKTLGHFIDKSRTLFLFLGLTFSILHKRRTQAVSSDEHL